jgi:hypothetical protein
VEVEARSIGLEVRGDGTLEKNKIESSIKPKSVLYKRTELVSDKPKSRVVRWSSRSFCKFISNIAEMFKFGQLDITIEHCHNIYSVVCIAMIN